MTTEREQVRKYFWNTVLDFLAWVDVRVARLYLWAHKKREALGE